MSEYIHIIVFPFQNVHVLSELRRRHDSIENLPEKSLTVCSGLDMVNITLNHFIFPDKDTAEVSTFYYKY